MNGPKRKEEEKNIQLCVCVRIYIYIRVCVSPKEGVGRRLGYAPVLSSRGGAELFSGIGDIDTHTTNNRERERVAAIAIRRQVGGVGEWPIYHVIHPHSCAIHSLGGGALDLLVVGVDDSTCLGARVSVYPHQDVLHGLFERGLGSRRGELGERCEREIALLSGQLLGLFVVHYACLNQSVLLSVCVRAPGVYLVDSAARSGDDFYCSF